MSKPAEVFLTPCMSFVCLNGAPFASALDSTTEAIGLFDVSLDLRPYHHSKDQRTFAPNHHETKGFFFKESTPLKTNMVHLKIPPKGILEKHRSKPPIFGFHVCFRGSMLYQVSSQTSLLQPAFLFIFANFDTRRNPTNRF